MRHPSFPPGLLAAGAAVLLFALLQTLRLWWAGASRRHALARARERGAAGEVRAEALLLRLGYTILDRQAAVTYGLALDGAEILIDLRADYVVSRRARRYVAEVKTGRLAPRIDTPATRRQLLEYRLAFDVDGVLLVDAEAGRVHTVDFPLPDAARAGDGLTARALWLLLGVAAGAIGVLFAYHRLP